jgi:acyl-CoA thioester hydrolase
MPEETKKNRADYRHFLSIPTRCGDNDIYGHVNNVVYYSYFDTVVNEYLIRQGALDMHEGEVIGFVVETQCRYYRALAFPEVIDAGMCVTRIGNSSVRYEIALFRQGEDEAAAAGHFVHVYVQRATNKPTPLPDSLRAALEPLLVKTQ